MCRDENSSNPIGFEYLECHFYILGKGRSRTFPEPYMEFPRFNEAFNLLL